MILLVQSILSKWCHDLFIIRVTGYLQFIQNFSVPCKTLPRSCTDPNNGYSSLCLLYSWPHFGFYHHQTSLKWWKLLVRNRTMTDYGVWCHNIITLVTGYWLWLKIVFFCLFYCIPGCIISPNVTELGRRDAHWSGRGRASSLTLQWHHSCHGLLVSTKISMFRNFRSKMHFK